MKTVGQILSVVGIIIAAPIIMVLGLAMSALPIIIAL